MDNLTIIFGEAYSFVVIACLFSMVRLLNEEHLTVTKVVTTTITAAAVGFVVFYLLRDAVHIPGTEYEAKTSLKYVTVAIAGYRSTEFMALISWIPVAIVRRFLK